MYNVRAETAQCPKVFIFLISRVLISYLMQKQTETSRLTADTCSQVGTRYHGSTEGIILQLQMTSLAQDGHARSFGLIFAVLWRFFFL